MLVFAAGETMPIYEYVCEDCHQRYEQLVMSREATIACPRCGSARHTLQLSVFRTQRSSSASDSGKFASGCGCTPARCGCK